MQLFVFIRGWSLHGWTTGHLR